MLSGKYYEMSSFGEAKAMKFAKSADCRALLEYNKRQLSRIYPAGARIDSSNYLPTTLWNAGCQLGTYMKLINNYNNAKLNV